MKGCERCEAITVTWKADVLNPGGQAATVEGLTLRVHPSCELYLWSVSRKSGKLLARGSTTRLADAKDAAIEGVRGAFHRNQHQEAL